MIFLLSQFTSTPPVELLEGTKRCECPQNTVGKLVDLSAPFLVDRSRRVSYFHVKNND